jgi:hypothetical protein
LLPARTEVLVGKLRIRKFRNIWWISKDHDALHNTLPLSPKTSHLNPLNRQGNYLRSSVTLPSHLQLVVPLGFFPLGFATKLVCTSIVSAIHATYSAHLIPLGVFLLNCACYQSCLQRAQKLQLLALNNTTFQRITSILINVLKVTVLIRDAQIPGVRSILSRGPQYLRALSMEFASRRPPGAWNSEVASIFLEYLHTPGVNNRYLRCG